MNRCRRPTIAIALFLVALGSGFPAARGADDVPWDTPTLHELGLHAGSAESGIEVQASGQVDIEYLGLRGDEALPYPMEKRGFVNGRTRLFIDTFIGERLYSLLELRGDRDEPPSDGRLSGRIAQAYLRYTPSSSLDFNIQAGKFVTPFGQYPTRHQTPEDPLIFAPLPYTYRSTICPLIPPGTNDAFISWKDTPFFRRITLPPIWEAPYQMGAMIFGSEGPVDYRLAVMTSGAASIPDEWSTSPGEPAGPSWVAHAGLRLTPWLKVGANYQDGTWLLEKTENALPSGSGIDDYRQRILGLEAEFAHGHLVVRGEVFFDGWNVPRVRDEARDVSWYIEGKYSFHPRVYAAARFGMITFNKMQDSTGARVRWDYPASQWDIGLGFRVTEHVLLRVGYQWNHVSKGSAPDDDLWAIRLSVTF